MANLSDLRLSRQELAKRRGNVGPAIPFLEYLTQDTERWHDDFQGDLFFGGAAPGVYYNYTNNSGTFTLLLDSTRGSIARLSTIGAVDDNYIATSLKGFYVKGELNAFISARIYLASIASVKLEIGFADATDLAGIVNVTATPSFNATDGVCWIFDTDDAGNSTGFQLAGVKAGVAATKIEPTTPTVAGTTYYTLGVQLQDDAAKGYIWDTNGYLIVETAWMAAAVTKTVAMVPFMCCRTRTAAAKTADVDVLDIWQRRTVT